MLQWTMVFKIYPVRLQHAFGIVPAGGYSKCSSFVCTDLEHQSAAAVSLLLKMKYVLNLLHMKAYLCIARPSVSMLSYSD